ncbi:hypothetical protein V8D89_004133 [Ganoderma adspersum]
MIAVLLGALLVTPFRLLSVPSLEIVVECTSFGPSSTKFSASLAASCSTSTSIYTEEGSTASAVRASYTSAGGGRCGGGEGAAPTSVKARVVALYHLASAGGWVLDFKVGDRIEIVERTGITAHW